jgi:hypothetical protein
MTGFSRIHFHSRDNPEATVSISADDIIVNNPPEVLAPKNLEPTRVVIRLVRLIRLILFTSRRWWGRKPCSVGKSIDNPFVSAVYPTSGTDFNYFLFFCSKIKRTCNRDGTKNTSSLFFISQDGLSLYASLCHLSTDRIE